MTREEFNTFCGSLIATTHVVQWGNSDVWKVGDQKTGKVFGICGWHDDGDAFTFKASDIAFEVLKDQPGIRPAPYLASRGFKWLQVYGTPGLSDTQLCEHLVASYHMAAANLSRKKRIELNIPDA